MQRGLFDRSTITMPVTNEMIEREKNCIGITAERKYYYVDNTFIKRSLRPHEWQLSKFKGTTHVPRQSNERLLNEAACLRYIRDNSNIPVPRLYCAFEDDNAVILVTEYVRGVGMNLLDESQRATVVQELEGHLQTLRRLKSSVIGGPSGHVVLPYRASRISYRDDWNLRSSTTEEFVFCHNDLTQTNVIVDPDTLKIKAIIDWEYAGFYPEYFERRFFERHGPSSAMDGEVDDSQKLVHFVQSMVRYYHISWAARYDNPRLTTCRWQRRSPTQGSHLTPLRRARSRNSKFIWEILPFGLRAVSY